jgi:chorismate-pyruvate lyase
VRAENSASAKAIVPADVRALLRVDEAAPVRHRHVRLTCGGHLLSEADNWYVPARLTPAMNHTLDTTDTPFGTVARPLNFHRKTVAATPQQGPTVLQVKAVLLTPQGAPISLVVENYSGVLIGDR